MPAANAKALPATAGLPSGNSLLLTAGDDSNWLLYKYNPDVLLHLRNRPDYHEPNGKIRLPEPEPPLAAPKARDNNIHVDPPFAQSSGGTPPAGLSCEIVRQRVQHVGYRNVRGRICKGSIYEFTATSGSIRFVITAGAADGVIISLTPF